jgi:eukaryotic translation initiation factor 2-alpha kinase 4
LFLEQIESSLTTSQIYFESENGTKNSEEDHISTMDEPIHAATTTTTTTTTITTSRSSLPATQYLYIQMEYCPNKTLRDVLDEGLMEEKEYWRLFRQMVEGLVHIHSQGMIHRDLKPSNVFLDSNGNVKIGDFGLAAIGDGLKVIPNEIAPSSEYHRSESHTSGIGTPVYVSPECDRPGARYNQKVDMYSLGIIFFELVWGSGHMAMERAHVLKDLRRRDPLFPSSWDQQKLRNETSLLLWMLDHNPKVVLNRLSGVHQEFCVDLEPTLCIGCIEKRVSAAQNGRRIH